MEPRDEWIHLFTAQKFVSPWRAWPLVLSPVSPSVLQLGCDLCQRCSEMTQGETMHLPPLHPDVRKRMTQLLTNNEDAGFIVCKKKQTNKKEAFCDPELHLKK